MKKLIIQSTIVCSICILFSGCLAAMINSARMPKETKNIKDYKSKIISDKTKADVFIYSSKVPFTNKFTVTIDGKKKEPMALTYYLYYQSEKGYHWIYAQNDVNFNTSYICKNIHAGKKEIIDLIQPNKNMAPEDMDMDNSNNGITIINKRSQVRQKTNILSSFSYNKKINSITLETTEKDNEFLNSIKESIEEKLNELSIDKGNDLTIKISSVSNDKGGKLPIVIYSYLSNNEFYYGTVSEIWLKLEFFVNGEKIDEYISKGTYTEDNGVVNRISSYIMCRFFGKQYPNYK